VKARRGHKNGGPFLPTLDRHAPKRALAMTGEEKKSRTAPLPLREGLGAGLASAMRDFVFMAPTPLLTSPARGEERACREGKAGGAKPLALALRF